MLGAIIGDVLGSVYERRKAKPSDPLVAYNATFSDNSVCTAAVAQAVMEGTDYAEAFRAWCRKYPGRGYEASFKAWAQADNVPTYHSLDSGALTRAAPAVIYAPTLTEAIEQAQEATIATHSHPVALSSVKQYAQLLWQARYANEAELKQYLEGKSLGFASLSAPSKALRYSTRADDSLNAAATCLRNADSFESFMLNARMYGGNIDTICAVGGPVAELVWGIPDELVVMLDRRVDRDILTIMARLYTQLSAIHPDIWDVACH